MRRGIGRRWGKPTGAQAYCHIEIFFAKYTLLIATGISTMTHAPAQPSQAASQQDVLGTLVGIACGHANEAMMAMVDRLVGALLDLTGPGADPGAAAQRIKSGNLLKAHSYAFFHLATTGVERGLRKAIDELAPAASQRASGAPAALALVPLEEMDSKIAFGALTRPFDIVHSEQLALLGARLGVLLGRDMLRAEHNPFRPEVFLQALHDAWREFEPDQAAHGLILPLLRPELVFDFAPMLEAMNQALARSGQAKAERFRKTGDAAAAKAAKASRQAALRAQLRKLFGADGDDLRFDGEIPLIPELPNMPQGNGSWRPSAAAGFAAVADGAASAAAPQALGAVAGVPAAGAHAAAPAPLLDMLARLVPAGALPAGEGGGAQGQNVFYLPRLKQHLPAGSLSRSDERTLDLLSRIFETVLLDDSIPPETRELIQFLQVPVLKAALRDNNFFFEEAHPARRMLDLLSRMGWERPGGHDDPMFQAMRRSIDHVGRAPEQVEAFEQAVAELESSLSARERAAEVAIAEPIAQALRQEKQDVARRSAREAVRVRVGDGEVVAVVSTFLENKWTTVLTFAYTIEDDKPGAVANATRTMDDLIWSVKPKATQEQRRALIARLPGLLTTLNKWLDAIKWQDGERLQFFARLAEIHASIVRAPIEASPERQLELAVEAAQRDALRRVAQESAAAEEEAPKDEAALTVDGLERGMWLAFTQTDGSGRKLKLAWVSPLRSLFIFSAGAGRDAFSMPAEKLTEAMRAGSARVVAMEGVVGRVLTEAMEEAVNDPSGATSTTAA
jgi:hypothetical protein